MANSICVIKQLVQKPFQFKSFYEKLDIVHFGRPCPDLPDLTATHKDKSQDYIRHFQTSQHSKTQWISGSSKLKKLFCWPYLLFASEQTVWSNNGYDSLNNLHNAIQKHEKSKSHISLLLHLKTFGTSRIDIQLDSQLRASIVQYNETVRKKNREVLKRFIDTVCFLATHELPFREHNEGEGSLNRGVYPGALNLLAIYDATLSTHLETSTTFRGTSNRIQNDAIRAVSDVVLEKIKLEIKNSTSAALLLDETSDIMDLRG
jgi:hypothetical protein